MGMKAAIPNDVGRPPCLIYWTGQVRLHVGVVTWCGDDRTTKDGVLQIPDDMKCCEACELALAERNFPKQRR